jgi:hypothetical protein
MIRSFLSSVMAQKERVCASLTIVFVSNKRDEFNMKKTKRKARHQKCMTGWHKIFGMPVKFSEVFNSGPKLKAGN